jgi:hypothetical protein
MTVSKPVVRPIVRPVARPVVRGGPLCSSYLNAILQPRGEKKFPFSYSYSVRHGNSFACRSPVAYHGGQGGTVPTHPAGGETRRKVELSNDNSHRALRARGETEIPKSSNNVGTPALRAPRH